jgi:hypothetical protein
MLELKIQCDCGQKYKFDVEPVNDRMPFTVKCPVCGADGTAKADLAIQAQTPMPWPRLSLLWQHLFRQFPQRNSPDFASTWPPRTPNLRPMSRLHRQPRLKDFLPVLRL